MGYQDIDVYRLKFEGRDGLEVSVEGLSSGALLDLMDTVAGIGDDPKAAALDAVSRPMVEALMSTLADSLVEWNVEDRDSHPVPMTLAGLKSLKLGLVMDVVTAWIGAQTGVDDDLGKDLSSGAASALEQSIPMEPLSKSRGS